MIATRRQSQQRGRFARRQGSRMYGILSIAAAIIAIVAAPQETNTFSKGIDLAEWWKHFATKDTVRKQQQAEKLPPWLRWLQRDENEERSCSKWDTLIDPNLRKLGPSVITDLIDKVLTSTVRLIAVINVVLCLTWLVHTWVADWFLGSQRQLRVSGGSFVIFKLMLISAVIAPDTLDLLIWLSWYTLLYFLKSLARLGNETSRYISQSGQPPQPRVLGLLITVFVADVLAAATCTALFHGAGLGMLLLMTCDCVLLGLDVVGYVLEHIAQTTELSHVQRMQVAERAFARNQDTPSESEVAQVRNNFIRAQSRGQLEALEKQHARNLSLLDNTVFGLQLVCHFLTICHFAQIWSLHGLHYTLIDGVLALQLHSALSSACKKIAERRNLHRIARDLDGTFDDATEMEIHKAASCGDVCCICLGTMSYGNVKKVRCGHLYHVTCLREVVERARTMEAARCPLCRASVIDGRHTHDTTLATVPAHLLGGIGNNAPIQQVGNGAARGTTVLVSPNDTTGNTIENERGDAAVRDASDRALFRFSTDSIFPSWVPVPALSFEVVRRPAVPVAEQQLINRNDLRNRQHLVAQDQRQSLLRRLLLFAGALPLTPEEEALALAHLVEMFPQYDRSDLLLELRARGSPEAVAETILLGIFTGAPRGS